MKKASDIRKVMAVLAIASLFGISACVIPMTYTEGAKPGAIKVGKTTVSDVKLKSGWPDYTTPDQRFFMYSYHRESGVLLLGGTDAESLTRLHGYSRLLIEFESGVVVNKLIHRCEKEQKDGICDQPADKSIWALISDILGEDEVDKYRQRLEVARSLAMPLQEAVSHGDEEAIKRLILQGANVLMEFDGRTPLHIAARQGQTAVAKLLIANGAYVDEAEASDLRTPLYDAAKYGHISVAQLLLTEGANVNAKTKYGNTPLLVAACSGHVDVVKLLLSNGADVHAKSDSGERPIHMAAESGNLEITQLLLARGAKVNVRTKPTSGLGDTPLHVAARHGHTTVGELLLANGAKVNSRGGTINGYTPLHHAVNSGHTAMVELLIQKGANVNSKAVAKTPLFKAVRNRDTVMAELLLAHGANVNANQANWPHRYTLLELAKQQGDNDIIKLLKQHGAEE